MQNSDRITQRLAAQYRMIRFDARERGNSGTSADYSVQGAVDDIGRGIKATGIERPILVVWSRGATEQEMSTMRAAAAVSEASNNRVCVFATRPATTCRS